MNVKRRTITQALIAFAFATLSGCAAAPTLTMISADGIFQDYRIAPEAAVENLEFVEVYFATNRLIEVDEVESTITDSRGDYSLGKALVSIPLASHELGTSELAFTFGLVTINRNPNRNIYLHDVRTVAAESWHQRLSQQPRRGLMYVHGYNMTFENATRIAAQLQHDIRYPGVALAFNWPSRGNFAQYTVDEGNIEWSEVDLNRYINELCINQGLTHLDIVAHSMGSRAVTNSVITLARRDERIRQCIGHVVLASPDIDAGTFKRAIAPEFAELDIPLTLYASSKDSALKASKTIHGSYPRVGESGEDLTVIEGVTTIDTTEISDSLFGHSDYAQTPALLTDLRLMLSEGLPPEQRQTLRVQSHSTTGLPYYQLIEPGQ